MHAPPFDRIKFDSTVLEYLGELPAAVAECLYTVFRDIRQRKIELEPLITWRRSNGPMFTRGCQHLIYASQNPEKNVVVVTGLIPELMDEIDPL